ncbi:hypothetical protein [Tautonia sociabilis]|uniref:Uncharacterized protein n=1 Tax=Tautonia sociabilis TaxID=2080755 RepID=A0A432MHB9_9BACT|nr:hypothetical protein [Tautonia sociabilis]RUL86172.1 hypothetical protein TsocGM_16535 [Tautonia sociabilis]
MIPMSCPNCGSQGEVPLDRLNSRLKCRKCGTMFYMDETGQIVLGDPNAPRKNGRRAHAKQAGPGLDVDLDLSRMVRDLPKPVRIGALGLAILVAIGYGVSTLLASIGLPKDVEGRTKYVGELFVDNKVDDLRALATPETADDLVRWHEETRPDLAFEGPRVDQNDVSTSAVVMDSSDTAAQSFVSLLVTNAPPVPRGAATIDEGPQSKLTLVLYWKKSGDQWLVDGARTLQEALNQKQAAERSRNRSRGR